VSADLTARKDLERIIMTTETSRFPSGELRASDADRDLAIAELSEHFQTGRLTQDEFGDRSARALQARTGWELTELFADLPGPGDQPGGAAPRGGTDPAGRGCPAGSAGPWGSRDPSSSREPWQGPAWTGPSSWPGRSPLGRSPSCRLPVPFAIAGVVAAIAVAGLLASVGHVAVSHGGFGWLIPVFVVLVVVRRIAGHR
jgi:hypothetical protein